MSDIGFYIDDDYEEVVEVAATASDEKAEKKFKIIKIVFCILCVLLLGELVVYKYVLPVFSNPKVTISGQVNYSASKAGIIGATKALAVELASRKITVNCIAPGFIETEMIKDAPVEHILPTIPMGRAGKPEEVASLAVFLLSESAAYIPRQVIGVNGGII